MTGERPSRVSRIARMTLQFRAWIRYVRGFKGIAQRVQEEHGRLFTSFALEAYMWLDDEFHPGV